MLAYQFPSVLLFGAGFDEEWVSMLEFNDIAVANGTKERVKKVIEQFKKGNINVFQGDYIGVNPAPTSFPFILPLTCFSITLSLRTASIADFIYGFQLILHGNMFQCQ